MTKTLPPRDISRRVDDELVYGFGSRECEGGEFTPENTEEWISARLTLQTISARDPVRLLVITDFEAEYAAPNPSGETCEEREGYGRVTFPITAANIETALAVESCTSMMAIIDEKTSTSPEKWEERCRQPINILPRAAQS